MGDNEKPTQLQSAADIGALEKANSVLSMCSEDMSLCSEDNSCYVHAQPIIDVTWRGGFDISNGEGKSKIHGLKAHLSSKACSKVTSVAVKIPKLISVELVPRLDTWPISFRESPPTDGNIAIYIFPEDESHEQGFNNLLDDIICGDLALKSVVKDSELLLFTSLQLPLQHRRFQGKIYLWGVFKGKLSPSSSYLSNDHLSVQSASINLAATAVKSNGTCADGINKGITIASKETNNDDVWKHGKPAETGKPGVTCNYCNQVYYGRLGIARLKKHLAGGGTKWFIKGCPKVPKEVEESMKETTMVRTKKLIEIGVSKELKDSVVHLKEKTVPGSISVSPEQAPSGGARTQFKPLYKSCVTSETPPKRKNMGILSGEVTTTLKTYGCQEQSEVRHVSKEKPSSEVVKKAKKGRTRSAKGVRGTTARSCTSNLLGEGGNNMYRIQQGDEIIKALPQFLIQKKSELPAEKVAEPQSTDYLCEEFTGRSSGSSPLEKGVSSSDQIEMEYETVHALSSLLPLPPETPVEKVTELQTHAAVNTRNSNPTPAITCTFSSPDSQQEDISVTPLEAALNVKETASQSTDASFQDIIKALTEQAESTTDSDHPCVTQVGPYTVKHNLGPTLQAIFDKYGDIAEGCLVQTSSARSHFLEGLCEVLCQLKDVQFARCRGRHLQDLLAALTAAESVSLDVTWLRQRYHDLQMALKGIKKYSVLKNDLAKSEAVAESRKKSHDSKMADTMRLQSEVEALNGQIASLPAGTEELESKMSNVREKAKQFRHKNLADGLL